MKAISITNNGSRPTNQDAFHQGENLFIVCDGVGGLAYGDVASKLACASLADYFAQNPKETYNEEYLQKALQTTTKQFSELIVKHPELQNMSTTVVLVAIDQSGATVGWMGDSRFYHVRHTQILFVTEDHSLLNELRKQGNKQEDELGNIRHIITRSLSAKNNEPLATHRIAAKDIQPGDYFFLCTDGVLENITAKFLCTTLVAEDTLDEKADKLFASCEGKTKDNFTFQLIEL